MVLVEFLGQLFQVVNGPGTTSQGTLALRKAPQWAGASSAEELARAMTGAQLDALIEMASWAETNLQGVTGTTTLNGRRVPRTAAMMHDQFAGADFGGRSAAEQRAARDSIPINEVERAAREVGTVTTGATIAGQQ